MASLRGHPRHQECRTCRLVSLLAAGLRERGRGRRIFGTKGGPHGEEQSGGGSLRWLAPGAGLLLLATVLGIVFTGRSAHGSLGTPASSPVRQAAVTGGGAAEHADVLDGGRAHLPDGQVHGLGPARGPALELWTELLRIPVRGLAAAQEKEEGGGLRVMALGVSEPAGGDVHNQGVTAGAGTGQWDRLVARYPWPLIEALSVLSCESRGDPAAHRDGNYGLFQINAVHAWRAGGDPAALLDPETNVRVAFDVWRDNAGWGPWACKP